MMIKIKVFREKRGQINGFSVNGHADTAPYGKDIVCAAVASITQTAALGLERHLARRLDLTVKSGKLTLKLLTPPDELTAAVLETMVIGLTDIAKNYPENVQMAEHTEVKE